MKDRYQALPIVVFELPFNGLAQLSSRMGPSAAASRGGGGGDYGAASASSGTHTWGREMLASVGWANRGVLAWGRARRKSPKPLDFSAESRASLGICVFGPRLSNKKALSVLRTPSARDTPAARQNAQKGPSAAQVGPKTRSCVPETPTRHRSESVLGLFGKLPNEIFKCYS